MIIKKPNTAIVLADWIHHEHERVKRARKYATDDTDKLRFHVEHLYIRRMSARLDGLLRGNVSLMCNDMGKDFKRYNLEED